MKRWLKLFLSVTLMTALIACKNFAFPGVYKIDIEQGNIVTQKMVDQLQLGMTRKQVRFILGTPLIVDTFNPDRWDYFYSMDDRHTPVEKKHLSIFFKNDALVLLTNHYKPLITTFDGEPSVK